MTLPPDANSFSLIDLNCGGSANTIAIIGQDPNSIVANAISKFIHGTGLIETETFDNRNDFINTMKVDETGKYCIGV